MGNFQPGEQLRSDTRRVTLTRGRSALAVFLWRLAVPGGRGKVSGDVRFLFTTLRLH